MGKPIAHNLLASGADLIVSNLVTDMFAEFQAKGAAATTDLQELGGADVIFLCLPNGEVVTDILLGKGGLGRHLQRNQIVIELSTIAYSTTMDVAKALAQSGVTYIDAPISGMEARAIDGTLTVICGGDRAAFDTVRPLFDPIGNKILYMGPPGSGQLTKLINQLLFDINAAALAEVLPLAIKMGLDPDQVGEVVNSGTGRSYASEFFIPRILNGHFSDGYPLSKAYKDLISGVEISARQCIPMPVLAAATVTYQMALLKGHGAKDKGAMIHVFEDLLGVHYRSGPAKS